MSFSIATPAAAAYRRSLNVQLPSTMPLPKVLRLAAVDADRDDIINLHTSRCFRLQDVHIPAQELLDLRQRRLRLQRLHADLLC